MLLGPLLDFSLMACASVSAAFPSCDPGVVVADSPDEFFPPLASALAAAATVLPMVLPMPRSDFCLLTCLFSCCALLVVLLPELTRTAVTMLLFELSRDRLSYTSRNSLGMCGDFTAAEVFGFVGFVSDCFLALFSDSPSSFRLGESTFKSSPGRKENLFSGDTGRCGGGGVSDCVSFCVNDWPLCVAGLALTDTLAGISSECGSFCVSDWPLCVTGFPLTDTPAGVSEYVSFCVND